MRSKSSYKSYEQFQSEFLKSRSTAFTAAVDDMADEMYQVEVTEEFDTLWDSANDDE